MAPPVTGAGRRRVGKRPGPLSVSLPQVEQARETVRDVACETPLVEAPLGLSPRGGTVYLKLESLQRTGSFKLRGALNKIAHLSPKEASRGVVAASAGNHAQGVAYAARARGIPATIVMPRRASPAKVSATESLGARVVLHGADYQEAFEEAQRRVREEGLTLIHPFDDPEVIAGQGTVALEILDHLPRVGTVIAGVGGGGLLAGIATVIRARCPGARIVAVQPRGSGTLRASLREGRVVERSSVETFADGLATRRVGDLPFQILRRTVDQAVEVSEEELASGVQFLLERAHLVTEGAGAAPVAALLAHPELSRKGPVVAVVSGGNIDPFLLDRILWGGLAREGRILRLWAPLDDRPGALARFLGAVAQAEANVRSVRHDRESAALPPGQAAVELELEVRGPSQGRGVLEALRQQGWSVRRVRLESSDPPGALPTDE